MPQSCPSTVAFCCESWQMPHSHDRTPGEIALRAAGRRAAARRRAMAVFFAALTRDDGGGGGSSKMSQWDTGIFDCFSDIKVCTFPRRRRRRRRRRRCRAAPAGLSPFMSSWRVCCEIAQMPQNHAHRRSDTSEPSMPYFSRILPRTMTVRRRSA